MEVQKGRPVDESGRKEKKVRTYDFLDALGVPLTVLTMILQ